MPDKIDIPIHNSRMKAEILKQEILTFRAKLALFTQEYIDANETEHPLRQLQKAQLTTADLLVDMQNVVDVLWD